MFPNCHTEANDYPAPDFTYSRAIFQKTSYFDPACEKNTVERHKAYARSLTRPDKVGNIKDKHIRITKHPYRSLL